MSHRQALLYPFFFFTTFLSCLKSSDGGIHGLGPFLAKEAPGCLKERSLQDFQGKKLAIDASMAMYQFLIAVRSTGENGVAQPLTSASGEETSHLQGFFWRTIAMVKAGIRPLYVFDGKPPSLKSGEIASRNLRRDEGAKRLQEATEEGNVDEMNKFAKRTTRVTKQHAEECKRLLRLLGVPTVDAPSEAEAQCAALAKNGLVYASATEDMDALCCGSPILVRRLTMSEARKLPVLEYHLDQVLSSLGLNMTQFVDFCILCGCDFSETIKGIGPKSALHGIRKHGNIESFIESLNTSKFVVPDPFPIDEIRQLLTTPEVVDMGNLSIDWNAEPDEEGLIEFLVKEKGFSEKRVRGGLEAIKKAKMVKPQGKLDMFFSTKKSTPQASTLLNSTFSATNESLPADREVLKRGLSSTSAADQKPAKRSRGRKASTSK